MSRNDDGLLERALNGYVTKVPGWLVAATALAFYPGLGLMVPLLVGMPGEWFFSVNVLGVAFASLVSLSWLLAQIERSRRRHLVDWTTNLRLLSAEEFEWFVGEVFRREGWSVRETGSQSRADGNIDLELARDAEQRFVQCKRWQSWQIPVNEIRSFAGTLLREGSQGAAGIFVTLSDFSEHAIAEARRVGIELIDGRELFRRAEAVRRTEPCPICHRPMMLGKSDHGWWFRCTSTGCKGKRHLDGDAGRAVDLLTQPAPAAAAEPTP